MGSVIKDRLQAEPQAPAKARDLVRGLEVDPDTRRNLELIVSELVSNSVRHVDASPDRTLSLRIECDPARIRGEVCDEGGSFEWESHEPDLTEPGGLGLMVVDHLADEWGIRKNSSACVWFECACPPAD